MPLATYDDLRANIAQWVKRGDLTDQIPMFITLAETRIARDLKSLNLERSQAVSTTAGVSSYSLPADSVSLIRVEDQYGALGEYDPAVVGHLETGRPRYYFYERNALQLYPKPNGAYPVTVIYKGTLVPLSSAVQTNDIYAQYPNIYLFASMVEAYSYLEEDVSAANWEGRYAQAVKSANKANNYKRKVLLATDLPSSRYEYDWRQG